MEIVHTASWPLCLVYKYGEFFTRDSTKTETLHVQKLRAGNNEWVRKGGGGRERERERDIVVRIKSPEKKDLFACLSWFVFFLTLTI